MGYSRKISIISFLILLLALPPLSNLSFGQTLILTPDQNVVLNHNLIVIVEDDNPSLPVQVTLKNLGPSAAADDTVTLTLDEDGSPTRFRAEIRIEWTTTPLNDDIIQAGIADIIEVTYSNLPPQQFVTINKLSIAYPTGLRWAFTENLPCPPDVDNDDDSDNDGICDVWEDDPSGDLVISHSNYGTYTYDCVLNSAWDPAQPACGSDKKDVFIEIDWMLGHTPDPDAIQQVINSFANSPDEIRLHLQVDSSHAIRHDKRIPFPGIETGEPPNPVYKGFDQIKGDQFGTDGEKAEYGTDWDDNERKLKHQVFHYALFVHSRESYVSQSGVGEIGGNDFMISLGALTGIVGSVDQQAGTFMHELGHNFGLNHGGSTFDEINNKPNYFSVMTYSRQWSDIDSNRNLDFSEKALGHDHTNPPNADPDTGLDWEIRGLNEDWLKEKRTFGLDDYRGHRAEPIIFSCPDGNPATLDNFPGQNVDWNCNGKRQLQAVASNINNLISAPSSLDDERLDGHNDWENLDFDFSDNVGNYADGRHGHVAGGVTPFNITSVQSGIPPNAPPGTIADKYYNYVSTEQPEMDLTMSTQNRISNLLTLYRTILLIPSDLFASGISESLLYDKTPKMNKNDTFKSSFLHAVKLAVDEINTHDLVTTQKIVNQIDNDLENALTKKPYTVIQPITNNLYNTYEKALDFKTTSIHDDPIHQPVAEPIISQSEINTFYDIVEKFVNEVQNTVFLIDEDPKDGIPDADCDQDGLINTLDETPGVCPVSQQGTHPPPYQQYDPNGDGIPEIKAENVKCNGERDLYIVTIGIHKDYPICLLAADESDSRDTLTESGLVIKSDSESESGSGTTVSLPSGSSVPGCEVTNECYIPAEITVNVGDTVTWSNDDTAAHTVTSGNSSDGPDGIFDSGLLMAGGTFSVTLEDPGTYDYFCVVHPWMIGTIEIG